LPSKCDEALHWAGAQRCALDASGGGDSRILRPGRRAGVKSKWGRHSCRPHSHQRVATLYLARPPANLPPHWLQRILGARCLIPARPVLRLAHSGFRHRRSRRHPAFASSLPRPIRRPKPPRVRCLGPLLGRGRVPFPIRNAASWRLSPFPLRSFSARFPACPVPPRVALTFNEAACIGPRPAACRLKISAWTDVTAILGIKNYRKSMPFGFGFPKSRVPKTG